MRCLFVGVALLGMWGCARPEVPGVSDAQVAADSGWAGAVVVSAEGEVQASRVIAGKYVLVNPQTGRVMAYMAPAGAQVEFDALIGKYVGVRGKGMESGEVLFIKVEKVTLMPERK